MQEHTLTFVRRITQWLIPVCIILLPFQTQIILKEGVLRGQVWQYGTLGVYATDVLILVIVVLTLIFGYKDGPRRLRMIWTVTGVLALTVFFSIYFSTRQEVSWYHFAVFLIGWALAWVLAHHRPSLQTLGAAFGLSGALQSAVAIIQFYSQRVGASSILGMALHDPSVAGQSVIESGGERFLRAYGMFPHPNILAGFLVVCALIVVGWYLAARSRTERSTALAGYLVILTGLFLTFSRTGWAALAAATGLFWFCSLYLPSYRKFLRNLSLLVFASLLLFGMMTVIHRNLVFTRIAGGTRLETASIEDREVGFQDAAEILHTSWLTGVGIGTFTSTVHDRVAPLRPLWQVQPVHNIYFLIAAELGIFGVLFFLVLIAEVVQSLAHVVSLHGPPSLLALVSMSAFVALLLIGLFDHYLWSLHAGMLIFWAVIGICLSAVHRQGVVDE